MSSTKKGNDWYFGMKAHVGVDADSGIVHSLETTTAKVHDSQVWNELLHGAETSVWADKGYVSATREAAFAGPGNVWGVMRKAPRGGDLVRPLRRLAGRLRIERRQIAEVRKDLDAEYKASDTTSSASPQAASSNRISSTSQT
jgi:IS5 family transposase